MINERCEKKKKRARKEVVKWTRVRKLQVFKNQYNGSLA